MTNRVGAEYGEVPELLDDAPCGFLQFDERGNIRLINRTLLELLGYRREQLIGRHVENILTKPTRIFYQTHWFPLLRLQGRADEIFLMLITSSGEEVGALVNAAQHVRGGEDVYECIVLRVHERQKYETELLRARRAAEEARAEADQANEAKSTFLAVMSHELRTPLNAISGYVDLIELEIQGPVTEAQRQSLQRIRRSQQILLRLINDILNLSRIEAGRLDYEITDVAVRPALLQLSPVFEAQFRENDITFEMHAEDALHVRADHDKLEQILINLIGNAIKFTPTGGRIRIDARADDAASGNAIITVQDTGIGIPADKLESVFEPFVQVHVDGPGHGQGTGLGLAISRDLARGMGGDLRAASAPGQGSTFTLTLPRADAASTPARQSGSADA